MTERQVRNLLVTPTSASRRSPLRQPVERMENGLRASPQPIFFNSCVTSELHRSVARRLLLHQLSLQLVGLLGQIVQRRLDISALDDRVGSLLGSISHRLVGDELRLIVGVREQ